MFRRSPERQQRAEADRAYWAELAERTREANKLAEHRAELQQRSDRIAKYGYPQGNAIRSYGVTFHEDQTITIGTPELGDGVTGPLAGAHATLENIGTVSSRVTVTRVAALGILALAVPKADKRKFLVVTGKDFEAAIPVDARDEIHLRRWIATFNTEAAKAAASPALGEDARPA